MIRLSQNKKILLSAGMLFTLSFVIMVAFLQKYSHGLEDGQTDVFKHKSSTHESSAEINWADKVDPAEISFVISPDGRFVYADEALQSMLKLKNNYEDELLFDYIDSNDLSQLVTAETEIIQSAQSKTAIGPIKFIHGKKESLVFLNAQPVLQDEENKVQYIIFTVYDISDDIEENNDDGIIKSQYPQIREMPDDGEHRFTAEKIGFKSR